MKSNIIAIVAAGIVAMTVSCTENVLPASIQTKGTIAVSVNGLMGEYTTDEPDSKASLISNIRVSWEGDETVYVFDGTSCLGSLTASLQGDDDRIAVLSGNISTTSASVLTLVYCPTLSAAPSVLDGKICIDLSEQTDTATPFVVYGTLPFDGTAITETIVPFTFATSVMKVNFTGFSSNTQIQNAMVNDVNTACVLSLSNSTAPTVSGDTKGIITRSGTNVFSLSGDGRGSFQMATIASAADTERKLSIQDLYNIFYESDFTSAALGTGKSYNTVYALNSTLGYVDLGLPSGTLWGTQNVGTSTEHPTGELYAWGETSPKSEYSWGTYKYCNGTEEYMTKYCYFSTGGVRDYNIILDAPDDAASVIFGTQWRTPSITELYELVNYTECEAAIVDGIEGLRLTSKVYGYKDASIFLPCDNYYWSSSLCYESGDNKSAYSLIYFNDEFIGNPMIDPYFAERCSGMHIRPVYSEIVPAKSLELNTDAISLGVGSTYWLTCMILPKNCIDDNIIWTVEDPDIAYVGESGNVFGLKEGTTTVTASWADDASVSASCKVTVAKIDAVPEAIDLGLTSGTKWASFNLGAASEYECGAFFAWGETTPRAEDAIDDYKWETIDEEGYHHSTKYYSVDNLDELLPEDDAATQIWGNEWRTPNYDEWSELARECSWSWSSVDNTFTATGPNDNTIKIYNSPYNEYMMNYYYLTATCEKNQSDDDWSRAKDVTFSTSGPDYADYGVTGLVNRSVICLIRPVYKPEEK